MERSKYVHTHGMPFKGKLLMVASSPAVSEQTGWPIGFWGSELTHPLFVFQEAGYKVEIASTKGGKIEMDSYSHPMHESGYASHDVITLGYLQQSEFIDRLEDTKKIKDINHKDYDAIFLVGGQAPMYTFRNNKELELLFRAFLESGKPAAAVCHATTLLLTAKGSDDELLVNRKNWTGFADEEEMYADKAVGMRIQPYWIETEARKIPNTQFKVAPPFWSYAITDGNLVTGQQQNSGMAAAKMVIDLLNAKK